MYERNGLRVALKSSSETPFALWKAEADVKALQASSAARVAANDTFTWWKTDLRSASGLKTSR